MKTIISILFILHFCLNAQTKKQYLANADYYFQVGDYYSAAKYYKNALKTDELSLDAQQVAIEIQLAHSYRLYNDYEKAQEIYQFIYQKDKGRKYPETVFWYAMMLKNNASYVQARKYFLKAYKIYRKQRNTYLYQKIVNEKLSCQFAKENYRDTLPIKVDNKSIGINTTNSEFAPHFYGSTFKFSSLRSDNINEDLEVFEENYYIKNYSSSDLNQIDSYYGMNVNIGNGSSDEEGHYYFSVCDSLGCQIYVGKWDEDKIIESKALTGDINLPGATFTQAFVCKMNGEKGLLYVSNRAGGFGRLDIWYAPLINPQQVGPSINLGRNVNTIDNDISPYYDDINRELYFSSEGHLGFGGFDIFKVRGALDNYSRPANLSLPINSAANDMYYYIDTTGNRAFLVSNRKGSLYKKAPTCCNDIWKIDHLRSVEEDTIIDDLVELNKKLPVILYFHNDCPNPKNRDTVTELSYMETYKDYIALKKKYVKEFSKTVNIEDKEAAEESINDFFEYTVAQGVSDLKLFLELLEKALEQGEFVKITIQGHASPLAKSDYNINLTRRRISSLKNYLKEYKEGVLSPYLEGERKAILIEEVPFGEYISDLTVSDDYFKTSESIYSVAAASERRIEIISVQRQQKDSTFASLLLNPKIINLKAVQPGDSLFIEFEIENNGNTILEIDTILFNDQIVCLPKTLTPGTAEVISFNLLIPAKIDPRGSWEIMIPSNAYNSKEKLMITYELGE